MHGKYTASYQRAARISSDDLVMNSVNCGSPHSASLLSVDHNFIIAAHVRISVWCMRLQCSVRARFVPRLCRTEPRTSRCCCNGPLRHLYKLFNLNPHSEIQQTACVGDRSWEQCRERARVMRGCHYIILGGAFSESAIALNNENAFTQKIHPVLKQQGNVRWQWNAWW